MTIYIHTLRSVSLTITCMKACLGWNHCSSKIPFGVAAIRYLWSENGLRAERGTREKEERRRQRRKERDRGRDRVNRKSSHTCTSTVRCVLHVYMHNRCVGVQRHRHGYIFHVRKPSKCTDFTYYNVPHSLRLLVTTARSSRYIRVATAYDPHTILE